MTLSLHPSSYRALERALLNADTEHVTALVLHYVRTHGPRVLDELNSHPLSDEWSDFIFNALDAHFTQSKGWVYAVHNPMNEGFIKVGKTAGSPTRRLAQLNNEAVLGTFVIVQTWFTHDRHFAERQAHRALHAFPKHKEFFHGDWRAICSQISQVVKEDTIRLESAGFNLPDPSRCNSIRQADRF